MSEKPPFFVEITDDTTILDMRKIISDKLSEIDPDYTVAATEVDEHGNVFTPYLDGLMLNIGDGCAHGAGACTKLEDKGDGAGASLYKVKHYQTDGLRAQAQIEMESECFGNPFFYVIPFFPGDYGAWQSIRPSYAVLRLRAPPPT